LLERFESPSAILSASVAELRETPGVGPKVAAAIASARDKIDVSKAIENCRRLNVRILPEFDPAYPRVLREIADPPAVLYQRGELLPRDALAVAIVGSRHATFYGKTQAERLAASLARAGLTVISGLARGIDACAHRAAMQAGGRTIAVLGNGLDSVYPPEHADLAEEVSRHGAVVSEIPLESPPMKGNFPQRNRIISGLSLGVIVVEAAESSGALVTARHAGEQGREVFAVPGPVDSRMSRGCHQLIRDGAKLVESAEDVLEELGPLVAPAPVAEGQSVHRPAELLLNEQESLVLNAVGTSPGSVDAVISACGLPTPQVLATLSVLEMRRLVRRMTGNQIVRL
jgi:DNA processing protein